MVAKKTAYFGRWMPISYEIALSILNNNSVTQNCIIWTILLSFSCGVDETKIDNDNKCISFAGHFDGHAGARMKYGILLDISGPGLNWKPLDAVIKHVFTLYCTVMHRRALLSLVF